MATDQKRPGALLIGLYVWILTVFLGMILIDILYSRLVPEAEQAFSEVSDFLLLIGFATLLSALAAIAVSWKSKAARILIFSSFVVVLLEFLVPAFLSPFIQNPQGLTIGPWLRVIPSGGASLLALLGMDRYYRQE